MDIVIYSNGEIQCSYNVADVFFFSISSDFKRFP